MKGTQHDMQCSHSMLLFTCNVSVHKVSRLLISQAHSRASHVSWQEQ